MNTCPDEGPSLAFGLLADAHLLLSLPWAAWRRLRSMRGIAPMGSADPPPGVPWEVGVPAILAAALAIEAARWAWDDSLLRWQS